MIFLYKIFQVYFYIVKQINGVSGDQLLYSLHAIVSTNGFGDQAPSPFFRGFFLSVALKCFKIRLCSAVYFIEDWLYQCQIPSRTIQAYLAPTCRFSKTFIQISVSDTEYQSIPEHLGGLIPQWFNSGLIKRIDPSSSAISIYQRCFQNVKNTWSSNAKLSKNNIFAHYLGTFLLP